MSRIVIIEGQDQEEEGDGVPTSKKRRGEKEKNPGGPGGSNSGGGGGRSRPPRGREVPPWGAIAALVAFLAIFGILGVVLYTFSGTPISTSNAKTPAQQSSTGGPICAKGDKEDDCFCPKDKEGKTVTGNACVKMVKIESGHFTMGTDIDAIKEQTPDLYEQFADAEFQHGVTIRDDFWVSKFEITFDQWDACFFDRDKNRVDPEGNPFGCVVQPYDNGWGRGDRPVINVSWNEAQQYVRWLSVKTSKNIRLLTESEWEYMARGGRNAPARHVAYAFTDPSEIVGRNDIRTLENAPGEPTPYIANYQPTHHVDVGRSCEYRRRTVPQYFAETPNLTDQAQDCGKIDSSREIFFPYINNANPLGIHFIHGNVWEWVQDCYVGTYRGGPYDGSARELGDDEACGKRVLRGGSWGSASHAIRVDYRNNRSPELRSNAVGFRIAWTQDDCIEENCGVKRRWPWSRNSSSGRTSRSRTISSGGD